MNALNPSLTLGIEEEYLLVDPVSRDLATDPPDKLFEDCEKCLGSHVSTEFLRSQLEIGTPVCADLDEAESELKRLRACVAGIAQDHGLRIIAASTHPFADWETQKHTPKERYDNLARDMGGAARRMLICGMHVHAGIENPDLRIDLMNQVSYFLPHLLALSTSSPFWQGQDMGMLSSRLTVFDGMPRTGVPDRFESYADYERLLQRMIDSGALDDASKIWWDARPSAHFPTLEMRITDVCTNVKDALSIAALYQAILRHLVRLRRRNLRWRVYPTMLLKENRWLAQRHGVDGKLVDLGHGRLSEFSQLIAELTEMVREDAEELGSIRFVEHARRMPERGTSARKQLKIYHQAVSDGAETREALRAVVDFLIEETVLGLD